MLLDALLAATDRLIVTYTGNDERTNAPRPPAVPGRRAARRRRPHGRRRRRARAGRRPPPAAAVRPAQLRSRRARARPAVELRPRRRCDGARALAATARRARRRSSPARCRPPTTALVELEDLVRFVEQPGAGVPAPAARRSRSATTPTRSRTRCRSSSTGSRSGASASGCSRRALAGAEPRRGRARRDRARDAAARACSAEPVIERVLPDGRGDRRAGARPAGRRRARVDVRGRAARRRASLSGTVPGVRGDVLRTVDLLARERRATGSPRGCGCSR